MLKGAVKKTLNPLLSLQSSPAADHKEKDLFDYK